MSVVSALVFASLPVLVLLLVAFAVIDRIGQAANASRLRLPWRKGADGRPLPAAGVEELHALYVSTKRHEIDERRTSLILREDEDDGAPPAKAVDLDAGTVVVRRPRRP